MVAGTHAYLLILVDLFRQTHQDLEQEPDHSSENKLDEAPQKMSIAGTCCKVDSVRIHI